MESIVKNVAWSFMLLFIVSSGACSERSPAMAHLPVLQDVPNESLRAHISSKKIFFGHQSVGANILEGVRGLVETGVISDLEVLQTDGPYEQAVLVHAALGRNAAPETQRSTRLTA